MTTQANAAMFKMQTLCNEGWRESGALMTCESGEWTPAQFATEAEGFEAVAKAWGAPVASLVDCARAVVVGSRDDLTAVILDMVKRSKCLSKNAIAYASHGHDGHLKEAARLRAIRDGYMARARALKTQLAELASVDRADYTHCTGCSGTGLDPRDGFTPHQPCLGQGGLYIEPVSKRETRPATMRHTATLEAMHTRVSSDAYNGFALFNSVESIAESGMTAEQMVVELQRALAEFQAHKTTISACFKATGAKVDAMTFADNS
jgi:hypothetical protein